MQVRPRWIATAAVFVTAAGLAAATQLLPASNAGGVSPPSGLARCTVRPLAGPLGAQQPGAFFKLQATLDHDGTLVGRRLFVGRAGIVAATAVLAPESAASGPVDGVVAVVEDDGARSTVELVATTGCGTVVLTSDAIVRRAIIDPIDGSLLLHEVDRASRADLGVWQLAVGAIAPTRVVEPLPAGLVDGPVWATDLRLDPGGQTLAVQSCVDIGCVTRLVDLAAPGRQPIVLRGASQGPILGFTRGRLVSWAACDGFPCPVLAWDPATGASTQLVSSAVAAGLSGDGRNLLAVLVSAGADRAISVDPTSGRAMTVGDLVAGERPILVGGLAAEGLEVTPDGIAVARPAGDPRAYHPAGPASETLP
jgi:hypothetical protein